MTVALARTPLFISDDEFVEAVVGVRAWVPVVTSGRTMLRAVTYDQIWDPAAPTVASCWFAEVAGTLASDHDVPGTDRCGLHAYREFTDLEREQTELLCVFGEVYLWGDVAIHERGLRAKYGRVKSLYWPRDLWKNTPNTRAQRLVLDTAKTYDVPITQPPELP